MKTKRHNTRRGLRRALLKAQTEVLVLQSRPGVSLHARMSAAAALGRAKKRAVEGGAA